MPPYKRRDLRPVRRWVQILASHDTRESAQILVKNIDKIREAVERAKLVRGKGIDTTLRKPTSENKSWHQLEREAVQRAHQIQHTPEYLAEVAEYHRQREEKFEQQQNEFEQQQKELEKLSEPEPQSESKPEPKRPAYYCDRRYGTYFRRRPDCRPGESGDQMPRGWEPRWKATAEGCGEYLDPETGERIEVDYI